MAAPLLLLLAALTRYEAVEPHMGSLARIVVYAPDQAAAARGFAAAFARIGELDQRLSDYKADSELSKVNALAPGQAALVSEDLRRVVAAAQKLAFLSDGAFDITLGAFSKAWRQHRLPAPRSSGYRQLRLERNALTLLAPGLQLDAGGIAKGFAADEALAVLRREGLPIALVALSGDIAAGDAPPGKSGWIVSIPMAPHKLEIARGAVSTSGDTEQSMEVDGRRYSHILDPRTGLGLTGRLTVSVTAPAGIDADSLATALRVLGPDKAPALLRNYPGARAYFDAAAAR